MRYHLGLYGAYMRLFWKAALQYRADMAVFFVATLVVDGLSLLTIALVFSRVTQLRGWGAYEVLLMYGLIRSSTALSVLLLNAPWTVPGMIRRGGLDVLLVRPPAPLFQLIGAECLEPTTLSGVLLGGAAIWAALDRLALAPQLWWLAYIPLAVASGAVMQFGLLLMVACLSFRFVSVQPAMYPVGWLAEFARFPATIYSRPLQALLTWVLPYATASFYPAAFLARGEPYRLPGLLAPLAGPICLGLALLVWRLALRRYQSTGS